MDLAGKVIVVTGGGQGLGRAIALGLADKGAHLALVDINESGLKDTQSLCEATGVKSKIYTTNVAKEEEVVSLFDQLKDDFGHLHGLVNNAGILRDGLLVKFKDGKLERKLSLQEWRAVIDVNLTGVFLCGREAAVKMIEGGQGGVIINISSISRAGNMGQSNYSAAKAGVASMAVLWAKELARYNIRAAAIAPGFINTEMVASMKPAALEKMTSGIPLKRLGEPEEIAHSVNYIFENDYFTGRVIEMDGGLRL